MELREKSPTLCLNMIVKNESRIIRRLLESVTSIIDSYCICDTGSTDNTIQVIEDYFRENHISGKIIQEPFVNFCHNRNVALQACIGLSDYVLLLDADMVLQLNGFDKQTLTNAHSHYIMQGNESFYYQNMRVVRNNGLYTYIGVTHEYIDTPKNNTVTTLDKSSIFIRDVGDGGSKQDKFERDIRLLTEGIQREPNNAARYSFYLANSYLDSGKIEEAIPVYKQRIAFGGWREEVWYSYYKLGLCYQRLNKFPDALYYWLEGFQYYPNRLEALYEIIKYYRMHSKHALCNHFYLMAKNILDKKDNRDSYLFLHNHVYTYSLYYEYTIFASYCGVNNINDEVVAVLNHSTNHAEIDNLLSNMKFYKDILKPTIVYNADNAIHYDIGGDTVPLVSSSSCLIPHPTQTGAYIANIRYVNYRIEPDGRYMNCDKHIITVNKCIHFDASMNAVKEQWMELSCDHRRYMGVEDVKIYGYDNAIQFIGTGYHANNKLGITSGTYDMIANRLDGNELTQQFNATNCEKNWVFVTYNDQLRIVYEWYPLKIGVLRDNHELEIVDTRPMPKIFSRVRGSTCGYGYNSEIWFVNHIVSYETPRHYYHMITVFDANMNLLRYSAPFKFEGEPIEYCLSIVVEDNRVLLNYSTWDRTTRIGVYEKSYVDTLLKYT